MHQLSTVDAFPRLHSAQVPSHFSPLTDVHIDTFFRLIVDRCARAEVADVHVRALFVRSTSLGDDSRMTSAFLSFDAEYCSGFGSPLLVLESIDEI